MNTFTAHQQRAIATPGNVAVVAGAGSGKTSTLVERCVACLLSDTDPASLDEILVVTFTEAAATEIRRRIRERLEEESKRRPGAERLEQQLALLDTAHIGTLHSFCLYLAGQHFHQLSLDPQFTVLEERQTRPLEMAVLDGLLAKYHAGDGPKDRAVQSLIRDQAQGSDELIRHQVLKLHRFTQTLSNPNAWVASQKDRFNQAQPNEWRRWLVEGFVDWRRYWLPALGPFERTANVAACLKAMAGTSANPALAEIRAALDAICQADQGEWPRGAITTVRDVLKEFFDGAEFLRSQMSSKEGEDPLAADWQCIRPSMLALLDLAQEFTAEFTRAKRELGGVDFADLEQLALDVLRDPRTGHPTRSARTWQEKLRYIFVDEYQDINAAQDTILALLSRGGTPGNRFLVGDVKQSIYRFRLADPRIFRDYERRWRSAAGGGQCVPLSDNFRSREALLEFINPLFRTLMRPSVGGVAYDPEAELRFGAPERRAHLGLKAAGETAAPASPRVEFHLLPKPDWVTTVDEEENGEDVADLDAVEKEARLVAHRLRQLREEGHRIWDKGSFRPVEWSDMVVLLRSVGSRAERFAKEFSRAGVPLRAARGGFYSALEVMDLLNLLRLLDNPRQDIPLLAVLRSPLVGLSVAELAQLRLHSPARPLWTALQRANEEPASGQSALEAELLTKVDGFLKAFGRWRRLIRQSSLSHCLETVQVETHYEALLLSGARGLERAANVRRLLDWARRYDPYQRQGLFRFLRFIEAQGEAELEEEPADAPTENAVCLMTIHKSKGLEWPVVVVAGLGAQFNLSDLYEDILLDEEYGLCPKVQLPGADQVYPSLAHWLAAGRAKRELLGEELRLLYVALTRARDTLVLAGTARRNDDLAPWASPVEPVSDREILAARNFLTWVRICLPQLTSAADWVNDREGQSRLLRWKIYSDNELASLSPLKPAAAAVPSGSTSQTLDDEAEVGELIRRVSYQYPLLPATTETAKTSVSALRRRLREETDDEARPYFQVSGSRFSLRSQARAANQTLSAADIGTAHHLFLQMVALERTGSHCDLRNEAERLQQSGALSQEERAALDFDALLAFWNSELGRKIRVQQANHIHRELPFTARMSRGDLAAMKLSVNAGLPDDEYVVVQGYADLAVILPAQIWLVDFKTDRVEGSGLAEVTKYYEPQLQLYALALGRIYRRPVTGAWLHFLSLKKSVAVAVVEESRPGHQSAGVNPSGAQASGR